MKRFFLLCVVAIGCTAITARAQQKSFSFGGFTLNSSVEQLKQSFPHSTVEPSQNSTYVRIAKEDVKDGVTSGTVYLRDKKPEAVHMIFEVARAPNKPDSYYQNPFNRYPRCEPVLAELKTRYGKPYGPFDNHEEAIVFKEYVWETEQEKLIFSCARFGNSKSKKQWAEIIKIGVNRHGYCKHSNCFEPPK